MDKYKEYKITNNYIFNEIPSHWKLSKVKNNINYKNGFAFKSKDFETEGVQLLKIANVYNNKLSLDRSPTYQIDVK